MRRTVTFAAVPVLILLLVAACQGPSGTGVPATITASTDAGAPGQSDTDWGRVWDGIPPSFPRPPGVQPAEEREPVSAAFDVGPEAGGPADVARFYADALANLAYTASVDGPLEDGAFVVEGSRSYTPCRVEVRSTPLGGINRLTILYGAGCPFT